MVLRKRHAARVEPNVDHLANAFHDAAALGAGQFEPIHHGTVEVELGRIVGEIAAQFL